MSEAKALCKELPVISVNKVVEKKIIIGKRGLRRRGRHWGRCPNFCSILRTVVFSPHPTVIETELENEVDTV
jgi:hypothetical protein